jgi:hydroxymethylpyrimidine pyrophosphatase-like HAD family hydrolase
MSREPWILATDLDGTFLGGTAAERRRFYRYLCGLGERFTLIFVTGRELENTLPLLADAALGEPEVPRPRYIVSDIGTIIVDGHTLEPIAPIQAWVAAAWGDANDRVEALLADEPGIIPQCVGARYRVSYFFDPARLLPRTLAKIEAAGFDWLLSDGRFLDVLPRGVSKGPALLRLLDRCGLAGQRVVVAGDTLNDLSLFETGLPGIAVGNAEDALVAAVRPMGHVHRSPLPGVLGIWDGLHAHGLCGPAPPLRETNVLAG